MLRTIKRFSRWAGLAKKRCSACGILTETSQLCTECSEAFQLRTGGFCPKCGSLSGDGTAPPMDCPECVHTPPPWGRLYFHNIYDARLREMILNYKFNSGLGRTQLLTRLATEAFTYDPERIPDVIVPVPLHTRRLLSRGFNQALIIANGLGKELTHPVLKTALTRIRHTPPQTRLGRKERQANIKGAFEADTNQVAGKAVLLVDDVYTTGATLRECTKVLKRAGAAAVDVLVLARAHRP